MGDSTVNGDMPQSAFLNHITSYPVVSDSISTFQSNPYGAKSIDLTNTTYTKFVKPTLPYLQTPASYAAPYIAKADQLGDTLLNKVDDRVPMVKSETQEIKGTIFSYAHWPLDKAGETREYVFGTYSGEYKKCGGDGYVAGSKALITSSLVISSDVLTWMSNFLAAKKAEAKEIAKDMDGQIQENSSS